MSIELRWRGGIAYIHGTIDGKRVRKSLGTRDPKIAEARKAQEEARLWRAATYGIEHETTFADACVKYLEAQADKKTKSYLHPIILKIGKQKLAKITSGQLRILAKQLYPDAKPQTWNRQVITVVGAVINFAHDLGMCPPIRIKRFAPFDEKVKRAVDRAWIDRFRAHATPHMAAAALFMFTTAARTSEALALWPCDLDLERRHGTSRTATKNGERREFWLTAEMADELKRLPPRPLTHGSHAGELRVFGWHCKSGFARAWRIVCASAGLDYVTPYEAGRHSFATECITRQERNVVMVAKVGNWANPYHLLRNYAHPEDVESFADEVFGSGIGTKLTRDRKKNLKLLRKSKG